MKKIITAVLAANMILSAFAAGVYAEEPAVSEVSADAPVIEEQSNLTQSEISDFVLKIKSKINIPDNLTEFNGNKYINESGTVYEFNWHDKNNENSVSVSINDKGDIISYSFYENEEDIYGEYNGRYMLSDISDDEVKGIVKEWIERLGLSFAGEIDTENMDINTDIYGSSVNVSAKRISNGIPVKNNEIYININKKTKKIMDFGCNWDYDALPSADSIISEEDAKAKYKQENAVELVYAMDYNNQKDKKAVLRYAINDININAKTGEKEKDVSNGMLYGAAASTADAGGAKLENSRDIVLTPEEIQGTEKLKNLISKEDAEKKILSLENVNTKGFTVNTCNYQFDDYSKKYILNVTLINEDYDYANVNLDAVTGDIISLFFPDKNMYKSSRSGDVKKIPEDEAKKIAESFIEKYNSKKSEYKYLRYEDNAVCYVRMVNGVPFYNDIIGVAFNTEDNTISSYHTQYTENVSFESTDGILTLDDAYNKLFDAKALKLNYVHFYNEKARKNDIKLVYCTDYGNHYIDAHTGKITELYPDQAEIYPTDISGHYAENAINLLIKNGLIVLSEDKFYPDQAVNQQEAMSMLGTLVGWYEPRTALSDDVLDDIYKRLIRRGIISSDEKNPSEIVTREKAVKYIVNAVGYTNLRYINENVFASGFNDVNEISSGYGKYVAAAKGLGIVKGDENGNFNPKGEVTKGQFAIMMYNALTDAK